MMIRCDGRTRAAYRLASVTSLVLCLLATPAGTPPAHAAKAAKGEAKAAAGAWTFDDASKLYQAQAWGEAARAFESVVKADPSNARAWYRLGVSYQKQAAFDKATAAYRRAEAIGHNPAVMYNLACAYSLAGTPDSAFAWLGRAADAGYQSDQSLQSDPDLESIRSDARFAQVLDRVRRTSTPCAYTPEARQFDFWVGSWDVKTAQGDMAGTNDIRLGAGQCVLVENWRNTQGWTGQSLNFYDADAKLWRQIWVDTNAGVTRFEGTFTEGQMRFHGERVAANGQKAPVKMTFTPLSDGRVRQMGEVSNDGGKTWTVEYDLYYSPARREG